MTRTIAWWIQGCSTLPWDRRAPWRLLLIQTCPHDARLTGHAPFLLQLMKGGGRLIGRWVMVTQITPSSYGLFTWHQTAQQTVVSHRSNKNCAQWGCQSLSFYHIISRTFTCSSGRSCDLVVSTNRVPEFCLGRAKGRGKKNHFPFAIFNLATLKVVVIYSILRYIKVNSRFYGSYEESFGKSQVKECFNIFSQNAVFKCMIYFLFFFFLNTQGFQTSKRLKTRMKSMLCWVMPFNN